MVFNRPAATLSIYVRDIHKLTQTGVSFPNPDPVTGEAVKFKGLWLRGSYKHWPEDVSPGIYYDDITVSYTTMNSPPTSVTITQPLNNEVIADSTVVMMSNVNGGGTAITKVDFYRDNLYIGSDTNPVDGWGLTWTNAPAGVYSLVAQAFDEDNRLVTSIPVNISVNYEYRGEEYPLGMDPNKEFTVMMKLSEGWNMVSLPVQPSYPTLSAVFPNAVVMYKYKRNKGYIRVTNVDALEPGRGYWLLLNSAQQFSITVQAIDRCINTISDSGWAMIGACNSPASPLAQNCTVGVIYQYVPGFGYQRVKKTEPLEPGKGYWALFRDVPTGGTCTFIEETMGF